MHALIVADGDAPDRAALDAAWPGWAADIELVVAADGGARGADALGFPADVAVGDFDSLGSVGLAELERRGVAVERSAVDKDETDTELAIGAAIRRGASRLTVVGAFGGARLDHGLANVGLLGLPSLGDRPMDLLDVRGRVSLLRAPGVDGGPAFRALPGPLGGLVSLIPWGETALGVTTTGLRFPLDDEDLPAGPARGLSNVRVGDASVALRRGQLLVAEGPATLRR